MADRQPPSDREIVETDTASDTERVGAQLAERLKGGDVVLLSGDLGAGKSTLVRGALVALGVEGVIGSPSFVVGNLYEGEEVSFAHLDFYRLHGVAGEDPGLLDSFFGPNVITFVEWPDRDGVGDLFGNSPTFTVALEHAGGDRRQISIDGATYE